MTKPLLYRWKGFEESACWCYRGRKLYDLLRFALERVYPLAVVKKALAAMALRGPREDGPDHVQHKMNVRGGDLVKRLAQDVGGKNVEAAVVLSKPLHHYLNKAFKCIFRAFKGAFKGLFRPFKGPYKAPSQDLPTKALLGH